MATNEQDLKARLQQRARSSGIPADYANLRTRLLRPPEEEQPGFFSSLVEGAAVGALEPLGFLPPVSRFLDAHMAPETAHVGGKIGYGLGWLGGFAVPATGALKLASAGMRASAVIGRLGLQGLQADRVRRFIASADAVSDLGFRGNLIRGSVAGALLGAGEDAEDGGDRLKNIAMEAAFFGIGDATIHPLMKAITGASIGGLNSRAVDAVSEIAHKGRVDDEAGAEILARAHRLVEDMFPEDVARATPEIAQRKRAVQMGLSQMQLQDLMPGQTRIVQSLRADASDIVNTLKGLPEIDYKIIKTKAGKKLDVADVLVARSGSLDDELVRIYTENLNKHGVGFFPGQVARHKGTDKIVLGPTTAGDKLWLYTMGQGALGGSNKGKVAASIDELVFLPHGAWRTGPRSVKNAAGEWLKFVEKHGEFPESFDDSFKALATERGWGAAQMAEMEDYFTARLFESLEQVDKPLGDVLTNLAKKRPEAHPDGDLAELGAQTGWIVGRETLDYRIQPGSSTFADLPSRALDDVADIPTSSKGIGGVEVEIPQGAATLDMENAWEPGRFVIVRSQTREGKWRLGYVKEGEKVIETIEEHSSYEGALRTLRKLFDEEDNVAGAVRLFEGTPVSDRLQLATTIKHPTSGNKIVFTSDGAAAAYMKKNPQRVPDFTGDIPSPLPKNSFGFQGASVMPDHTAAELANARVPKLMLGLGAKVLPRLAWFRMMDDILLKQGIETDIFSAASRLQEAILRGQNARIPWVERLEKMRTAGIRDEKLPIIRDLMLQSEGNIARMAKAADLNREEVEAAKAIKGYMRDLISDINKHSGFGVDADEFMEVYMPEIITRAPGSWQKRLTARLAADGKTPNKSMMEFATEMERAGIPQGRHENNPFIVALRWTSAAFTKRHVDGPLKRAFKIAHKLPNDDTPAGLIRKNLVDGIKVAYGGTPEAYYVTRVAAQNYFKNLDIKLEPRDMERVMNTLVSMNYGAFMGFRPALALRDLSQTVFVTLPLVQSPKHMGKGLKFGFTTAGRDEARAALAIPPHSTALHLEDVVSRTEMYNALASAPDATGKLAGRVLKVTGKMQEVAHVGLGGEVTIAGRKIPTGLYGRVNDLQRSVAYHAQKSKTLEAMNRWLGNNGHGNITRFNEEAGLTMFGEAQTREFHKLLNTGGRVKVGDVTIPEAVRWISVQMANESQWVYQMGAGPAAFSQGLGRLFGMYGTWPTWYVQHLIRGATRGTVRDRARFWGWSAATLGAMTSAAYATGINFNKWSPLNSLGWTGGPALDFFADWREIWGGARPPGEPPTPGRALALGQRGLQDTGDRVPIPVLGHLDPRRGKGLDVVDPMRMGRDVLYLFTPGAGQIRNIIQAHEEDSAREAVMRAIGLPGPFRPAFTNPFGPVAGASWPQINIR